MEELLHHLEKRIQQLVLQHDSLKQGLMARQQKAISQIETLIAKLKAMETQP